MTTSKPKRRAEWNAVEELDFDDGSNAYDETDHAALEALTVHLGSEHYFDRYPE